MSKFNLRDLTKRNAGEKPRQKIYDPLTEPLPGTPEDIREWGIGCYSQTGNHNVGILPMLLEHNVTYRFIKEALIDNKDTLMLENNEVKVVFPEGILLKLDFGDKSVSAYEPLYFDTDEIMEWLEADNQIETFGKFGRVLEVDQGKAYARFIEVLKEAAGQGSRDAEKALSVLSGSQA